MSENKKLDEKKNEKLNEYQEADIFLGIALYRSFDLCINRLWDGPSIRAHNCIVLYYHFEKLFETRIVDDTYNKSQFIYHEEFKQQLEESLSKHAWFHGIETIGEYFKDMTDEEKLKYKKDVYLHAVRLAHDMYYRDKQCTFCEDKNKTPDQIREDYHMRQMNMPANENNDHINCDCCDYYDM